MIQFYKRYWVHFYLDTGVPTAKKTLQVTTGPKPFGQVVLFICIKLHFVNCVHFVSPHDYEMLNRLHSISIIAEGPV